MDVNLFEIATRKKWRFPSVAGDLDVEQLWDLPLTAPVKNGVTGTYPDLDGVAKALNQRLKSVAEESFVSTKSNPQQKMFESQLELVKHIIAVRIAEAEERKAFVARSQEREKLKEILANKQDDALKNLSEDEIKKRLAELEPAAAE